MCYSTTLRKEEKEIEKRMERHFEIPLEYEPYYHRNGFTHQNLYIIPMDDPDEIIPAMWGLVPKYGMKDIPAFQKKYNTLNARSESIFKSNTFKDSVYDKRCIILADGFHEPHHKNGTSFPYFCHYKDDGLFYFAGLYSKIDTDFYSCTILTVEANDQFAEIHNKKKRMPLVLDEHWEFDYLDPSLHEKGLKELINVSFTTKEFEAYPVSRNLYKPEIDTNNKTAITKVNFPELNKQETLF